MATPQLAVWVDIFTAVWLKKERFPALGLSVIFLSPLPLFLLSFLPSPSSSHSLFFSELKDCIRTFLAHSLRDIRIGALQ